MLSFHYTQAARAEEELNAHSKFTNQLFDANDSQQNGPTFVAVVSVMYFLFIFNSAVHIIISKHVNFLCVLIYCHLCAI
jgi:hypothetical protein